MNMWDSISRWITPRVEPREGDDITIPQTITPWGEIVFWNGLQLAAVWIFLAVIISVVIADNIFWSGLLTLATFGVHLGGSYTVEIPDWHGGMVFNPLTRKRRVLFAGLHFKVFFETLEGSLTPLKREISSVAKVGLPTNDPAELMEVEILIHSRLDTRPRAAAEDAEMFIRFRSIEDEAFQEMLEAQVVRMFGAYYAQHEMEELTNLSRVQKGVLNAQRLRSLNESGRQFARHIGIELRKSQPDEKTKETKRTPARASALNTAIKKLMAGGMTAELARRAALLLDPNSDYTERQNDWTIDLNARGLENLQNFSAVMPPGMGDKDKKGKK